jgi:hypothetical protein
LHCAVPSHSEARFADAVTQPLAWGVTLVTTHRASLVCELNAVAPLPFRANEVSLRPTATSVPDRQGGDILRDLLAQWTIGLRIAQIPELVLRRSCRRRELALDQACG